MTAEMERLKKATKTLRRRIAQTEEARKEVVEAVLAALRVGERPTDVAKESPYTPAHIRKVARQHGIEPAPPGRKPGDQ